VIFDNGPYLCVGADPHVEILESWGLEDSIRGLEDFTAIFLASLPEQLKIVKPQVSLFERFGAQGFAVLEKFLIQLNEQSKYVIADAKRSDIGSSMAGYADAWLSVDAPFMADAVTVSPYMGVHTLVQTFEVARENNKRVFVLAATSNPEAREMQSAGIARTVIEELCEYDPVNLGVVVGATVDMEVVGIHQALLQTSFPILAPGFGEQGATLGRASEIYAGVADRVIANVSRSVLRGHYSRLEQKITAAISEIQ
jgi:orotidine-5'-phosphate decarboxylase